MKCKEILYAAHVSIKFSPLLESKNTGISEKEQKYQCQRNVALLKRVIAYLINILSQKLNLCQDK